MNPLLLIAFPIMVNNFLKSCGVTQGHEKARKPKITVSLHPCWNILHSAVRGFSVIGLARYMHITMNRTIGHSLYNLSQTKSNFHFLAQPSMHTDRPVCLCLIVAKAKRSKVIQLAVMRALGGRTFMSDSQKRAFYRFKTLPLRNLQVITPHRRANIITARYSFAEVFVEFYLRHSPLREVNGFDLIVVSAGDL